MGPSEGREKAGFKAPADQPDIDPPHEALQLAELFRELVRLPETKERGKAFLAAAEAAEGHARASRLPCELRQGADPRSPEAGRGGVPRGRQELHGLPREPPR